MLYTVNTIKHKERKPNYNTSKIKEGDIELVFGDFTYNLSYILVDYDEPTINQIQIDRQLKFMVNDRYELLVIVPSQLDNMYNFYLENDKLKIIRNNGTI